MTLDDNDALRRGALPQDPFAGALPMQRAGAAPPASQAGESRPTADVTPEGEPISSGLALRAPELPREARYGLAGQIVNAIEPETEGHPAAILVQLLVAMACLIGRGPHFVVGATRHWLIFFAAIVGTSAKSRKGTSWDEVAAILSRVDPEFVTERIKTGLVSGEGIVHLVRDDKYKYVLDDSTGEYKNELVEEGVPDKRLIIQESEFARVLTQLAKDGNTLSAVIRDAWDGRDLATLGKVAPLRATAPHIAIVAHITQFELALKLSENEAVNGFGNRFLWAVVHRSKLLPSGGALPEHVREGFAERLRDVVDFARTVGRMARDDATETLWRRAYSLLSTEAPGQFGALTARAEAQVLRLACVYALLDRTAVVRVAHLRAALALWRYCSASARALFGQSLGNALVDEVARLLQQAGPTGLTRTELRDAFGRHRSRQLATACEFLIVSGLARVVQERTAGRSADRLVSVQVPRIENEIDRLLADTGPRGTRAGSATEAIDLPRPLETPRLPAATKATEGVKKQLGESATEATEAVDPFACLASPNIGRFGRTDSNEDRRSGVL